MNGTSHSRLALLALGLVLAGCSKGEQQQAAADSSRNLEMAPADTTGAKPNDNPAATPPAQSAANPAPIRPAAPKPAAPKPSPKPTEPAVITLPAGTTFTAEAQDTISSRHTKAPVAFSAPVHEDIKDKNGRVVIPAGAVLRIRITELAPAENKSQKDGKLAAILLKVTINGTEYKPAASIDSIAHLVKGRGVTGGDVAKVGAGAAAGAVVGGLIGKGTGAVIGGVVGAGAGTAVAAETADRDVVIVPGSHVYVTLTSDFTVPNPNKK
ncbi:MAG TPA: hypothetical protein VJN95_07910 [Gemmatimonadales bacterium]|nr:hypothetical protein [Gemmatimonadales bacterium]